MRKEKVKTNLEIAASQAVLTVGVPPEVQYETQILNKFCCVSHLEIEKNIKKYKMTKFTHRQEYLPRLLLVLAVTTDGHRVLVQDFVERPVLAKGVVVAHADAMVLLNKKYIS